MIYGYAWVSTKTQDLAYQLKRLAASGCNAIFQEKRSGKNTTDRPELETLLGRLRPGDVLLATASDRVARDPLDLVHILKVVKEAGAGLRLIDEPFIDTTSEMADLIAYLVGWAAKWHRRRILECTAQGRELAKLRGVRFGRKPKVTAGDRAKAMRLQTEGMSRAVIAQMLKVSESTVARVLGSPGAGATVCSRNPAVRTYSDK